MKPRKRDHRHSLARWICGHDRVPANTASNGGCLTCKRAHSREYNRTKRKLLPKRRQTAAERCTGKGGVGCECRYHEWRRQYRAAKRERGLALVVEAPAVPPDPRRKAAIRHLPTERFIEEVCRPLYERAIAPPKPKGRPRKVAA